MGAMVRPDLILDLLAPLPHRAQVPVVVLVTLILLEKGERNIRREEVNPPNQEKGHNEMAVVRIGAMIVLDQDPRNTGINDI